MNIQVIPGNDAAVSLNTGAGGAPSPGETRVTLIPAQIAFVLGANDLFFYRNGVLQVLGVDYVEEDLSHVVLSYLVDAAGPFIDELIFRSAAQGSSTFIPAPTFLKQAVPPARPDNFGGLFSFA